MEPQVDMEGESTGMKDYSKAVVRDMGTSGFAR